MEHISSVEKIPEYLKCPSCIQIPEGEMYQCRAGHFLCDECYPKVENCPQCQAQLETEPIHALIVEKILDELNLGCKYGLEGCDKMFDRKNFSIISGHEKSCHFNVVKFGPFVPVCKNIGFENCSFQMNRGNVADAIKHFESVHQACKHYSDTYAIEFQNYSAFEGGYNLIILDRCALRTFCPQDVTENSINTVLILIKHKHLHGNITCLPFYIPNIRQTIQGTTEQDIDPDPDLHKLSSLHKVKFSLKIRNALGFSGSPLNTLKCSDQDLKVGWNVSPLNILECSDQDLKLLSLQLSIPIGKFGDQTSGSLFAELKVKRVIGKEHFSKSQAEVNKIFTTMDMIGRCQVCLVPFACIIKACCSCGTKNPNYMEGKINKRAPVPAPAYNMASTLDSYCKEGAISASEGSSPVPSFGGLTFGQSTMTDGKASSPNFQFVKPQVAYGSPFNFGAVSIPKCDSWSNQLCKNSIVMTTVNPSPNTASLSKNETSSVSSSSIAMTSFTGFSFGLANVSAAASTTTTNTTTLSSPFHGGLKPTSMDRKASLLGATPIPGFGTSKEFRLFQDSLLVELTNLQQTLLLGRFSRRKTKINQPERR